MGSILEGYQFKNTISEPSKEMLEMSPKSFYKNSYGLAKKFLGESHQLTHRLHFCYHKSEFLLFKEINSTENSDIEKHKTPKKRLKYMLDEIDDEDTTTKVPKSFRLRNHSPQSNSSKSLLAKNINMRRSSQSSTSKVKLAHRQSMETSTNSHNNSFEDNHEENNKSTNKFNGSDYKKYMTKLMSPTENNQTPYMHRRKSAGTTYKPHSVHNSHHSHNSQNSQMHQQSYTGPVDQTQILLQVMFHQQRDLEEKLNKKFEELKGISRINTMDTSDMKFIESKEDPKIKILEKEIETLKEKMFKMNVENEMEERPKSKGGKAPVINLPNETNPSVHPHRQSESKDHSSLKTISTVDTTANPHGKESESSTKSNGNDVNYYLSPHRLMQLPSGRPDKNSFEHNNTGLPMLEPLSPISKDEKLYFGEAQQGGHPKEPNWVPGKYSDPKSRKFQLDLNKVGSAQGGFFEEEKRHRQNEPEAQTNVPQANQAKKENVSSEFANFNKLNNFMQHEPNKGVPKLKDLKQSEKIPLKKFQSDKSQNSVESSGAINTTTTKEDQLKKFVSAVNDSKTKTISTVIAPLDKTDKDVSSMSIKLVEHEKNSTRTQKEDQSDQGNDKTEKKVTDDDDSEEAKSIIAFKRNSISIPTSIDFMDSLHAGQFNPLGHAKVPKFAVIKKRVFMDDDTQYMIACKASWTREEKVFKLQLMGVEEKTGTELTKVESELELPYKDLKSILKHIEHKDVMPVTLHIKQIKNFYTIVRFLLMPFTTVFFALKE